MKKTIITAMVAVSALGFSGTSFADGAAAAAPDLFSNNNLDADFFSKTESNTFTSTLNNSFTSSVDESFSVDKSINAAEDAPAAGGDLQVAYDAPAVGGDMITVNASAIAIQLGDVASTYPELAFMGSGGVIAGSGAGSAAAEASPLGGAAAAGGASGNVTVDSTTGAVSTGAVTIDLSNSATALAVGGSYNYNTPAVNP